MALTLAETDQNRCKLMILKKMPAKNSMDSSPRHRPTLVHLVPNRRIGSNYSILRIYSLFITQNFRIYLSMYLGALRELFPSKCVCSTIINLFFKSSDNQLTCMVNSLWWIFAEVNKSIHFSLDCLLILVFMIIYFLTFK